MYTRYKEDIKMMKNMGFTAYRFSISWPRILPGGKLSLGVNREGIDFYNDLINTLLENKIEPYVTLFHWDLPYTLEQEYGGFLSKQIVKDFRDFAELCFWEFGDRVKYWITLNEPWTYSVHGYVGSTFPPGKVGQVAGTVAPDDSDSDEESDLPESGLNKIHPSLKKVKQKVKENLRSHPIKTPGYSFIPFRGHKKVRNYDDLLKYGAAIKEVEEKLKETDHKFASAYVTNLAKDVYTVGRNLLLAHAAAVESYRTIFKDHQKGKIGITLVTHWFEPYEINEDKDREAAKRALDFMLGWFLEPILTGSYPQSMIKNVDAKNLASFTEKEKEKLRGSMDFLGLNYYTSFYAKEEDPGVVIGYNKDQKLRTYHKKDGEYIGEKSGAKWLHMTPWGFYNLLERIDQKYNNDEYCKYLKGTDYKFPDIYITENGYADMLDNSLTAREACKDTKRVRYYQDHLGHLQKAIKNLSVDIKGYFAWSWCDNFEWADGYTYRFGLVYIDYVNNLKRYPKDSAKWFAKFLVKKEQEKKDDRTQQNSNQNGQ